MTNRQQILTTIRAALSLGPGQSSTPSDLSDWPDLGPVLPPIATEDLVPRLELELTNVGAAPHHVRSRSEIANLLTGLLKRDHSAGVVLSRNPLLARLGLEGVLNGLGVPAWTWPAGVGTELTPEAAEEYRGHCFSAAVGITGVDFALAESGTLVLSSVTEGSQLSSLAPPVHIAFCLRQQVVGSLEEVLAGLPASGGQAGAAPGRSVVFVTGTSRTADIEQILIRGVHGPREVHVVLVDINE